jgi:hypothetical protein
MMTARSIDPQLRRWFDQDQIVEALIGDGDFFVGGHMYQVHNRLLVIRQLLYWAADEDAWDRGASDFQAAVESLVNTQQATDAYDLVQCYFIVRRSVGKELPLDLERLHSVLRRLEVDPRLLDASSHLKGAYEAVESELRSN